MIYSMEKGSLFYCIIILILILNAVASKYKIRGFSYPFFVFRERTNRPTKKKKKKEGGKPTTDRSRPTEADNRPKPTDRPKATPFFSFFSFFFILFRSSLARISSLWRLIQEQNGLGRRKKRGADDHLSGQKWLSWSDFFFLFFSFPTEG